MDYVTRTADLTDAALLVAIGNGDDAAFAVIYRRYLPIVLRWCLRETGNRELASDLSAEVFATALLAARRYRPEQGAVIAWLLGIARNKLSESRRHCRVENSARRKLGLEMLVITDEDLERVEERASLNEELIACVADLPKAQRAAIISRIVQERPYAEIAAELRCSESVIRQRVSRGLKAVRARMEG